MATLTKSGIFYREEKNLGLLLFSPYTGNIFSASESVEVKNCIIAWLNKINGKTVPKQYLNTLGPGWAIDTQSTNHISNRFISTSGVKLTNYKPYYPIVLNWLITTRCQCSCLYCYAKDVMMEVAEEPTKEELARTAESILKFKPLAVVITGGDPLYSENLDTVLSILYKKTGLVLDTNGVGLTKRTLTLLKKYKVFIRISIDTLNPKENNILRPLKFKGCSLQSALKAVEMCVQGGLSVGIQSVVTKKSLGNLFDLRDRIPRLGVSNWRVQLIAGHKWAEEHTFLQPNINRFYKNIVPGLTSSKSHQSDFIPTEIVHNDCSNSVVLILPNGEFRTEVSKVGKVLLDKNNPTDPPIEAFHNGPVNQIEHTFRYVGKLP